MFNLRLRFLCGSARRYLLSQNVDSSISASISTTASKMVKEIRVSENDEKIVVEAVKVESERTSYLVEKIVEIDESLKRKSYCGACPLCKLNLKRLAYSDVLILEQFIESNGTLIAREFTGLCHKSYAKVRTLVKQSQKAKLLPRPPNYESPGVWDDLARYYEYPKRTRDQPMNVIKKEYWNDSIK
ncbi:hypothetical protein RDWZM_002487 [Blomia tropicalis]|uniref:28S ribosomal protein S18a, mitochondrial n=1 Tax=Blomia tropicalis TaxID=40697 RepID=A0A9Q0ME43_BLOTA|nr:hypothetical protein RDWZM_002487 [Blomia tropicalis]